MADILVRGLDPKTVKTLKAKARRHGRSLQSEVKRLLERSAGAGNEELDELFRRWDKQLKGKKFSSSAELIREDRER